MTNKNFRLQFLRFTLIYCIFIERQREYVGYCEWNDRHGEMPSTLVSASKLWSVSGIRIPMQTRRRYTTLHLHTRNVSYGENKGRFLSAYLFKTILTLGTSALQYVQTWRQRHLFDPVRHLATSTRHVNHVWMLEGRTLERDVDGLNHYKRFERSVCKYFCLTFWAFLFQCIESNVEPLFLATGVSVADVCLEDCSKFTR